MPTRESIDLAKEKLRIPDLWRLQNLPGEPPKSGRAGHSPFREDRHPSFAIYDDGKTAFDFGTGTFYDGVSFFAEARGGLPVDHRVLKEFVELAGGDAGSCEHASSQQRTDSERRRENARSKPDLSKFWLPTKQEIRVIARDRGLSVAAPEIAKRLGCLKTGDVCGYHSWLVTDPGGQIAEGRRFGRLPYPACGELGERKAHTLRGSCKSWPLGLGVNRTLVEQAALIVIVEGSPDYLAAWHFVYQTKRWDVLPIAILGRAIHGLHAEALKLLKGKRIRFYPHIDPDGGALDQISLIHEQLRTIGCRVSYFDFSGLLSREGAPIKDLNDVARLDPTQFRELFL